MNEEEYSMKMTNDAMGVSRAVERLIAQNTLLEGVQFNKSEAIRVYLKAYTEKIDEFVQHAWGVAMEDREADVSVSEYKKDPQIVEYVDEMAALFCHGEAEEAVELFAGVDRTELFYEAMAAEEASK